MPQFSVTYAGELSSEKKKELYNEVAKTIARVKECPISAVSGVLHQLPLDQIGQGAHTWEEILSEEL